MATIKTCTRCKGTGKVNSSVVYCGMPGTCYKCDGMGKTRNFTMAERVAKFAAGCERHLHELEQRAAELQHAIDNLDPQRRPHGIASRQRELQQLRDTYRTVRQQARDAQQAGKVTATQCPTTEPAR